ncbi:MAG TPA: hypothetical protein VER17_07055, partial [Tepidisphaeraceae bacterium]|nr:hypothetical protein [Tepidisphaeraceae bacterium]
MSIFFIGVHRCPIGGWIFMIETATPSKPQLAPPAAVAFAYEAQTIAGQPVSGTIDAPSMEQAQRLLAG